MKGRYPRVSVVDLAAFVIVVSILTGAAAPRFGAVREPTPADAIEALAGSMRSASALVHAVWQADGGTATSVDLDGTPVAVDALGFPTRASIRHALWRGSAESERRFIELEAGTGVFAPTGTAHPQACHVIYHDATLTTPPRVVAVDTDCS
ncbi:MAG: hypothetical protein RLW61_18635 [Gammaproteobacteria bacterium]